MTQVVVTQADESRALEIFNDALGDMGSFAEYGRPSYQDGALRTIAVHLARHRLSHTPQTVQPVAVIGRDWRLLWASQEPLARIVEQTSIKIGSPLYAKPDPNVEQMRAVLQAIEKEGMKNHATRCAPWWNDVCAIIREKKP